MSIADLERALQIAQARVGQLTGLLASGGASLAESLAAGAALLEAERALAAARGEPHAVPLDIPAPWGVGAPMPHVLQNDFKCFLTYYLREPAGSIGAVEFVGCQSVRFGTPNDEVRHGHPLYGRGLDAYGAQQVVNSPWLVELERINSVHHRHDRERWSLLSHYIFGFHDNTFECVARSFSVETREASMADVLQELSNRLVGGVL